MISYLKGTIIQVLKDAIIINVNGVGYEVKVIMSDLAHYKTGETIEIYTHFHVREDVQALFGFKSMDERTLFRQFISVNGIGPKSAMAALNAASINELIQAIQAEDHAIFQSVPGIGSKTAKRLVMELRSKVDGAITVSVSDIGVVSTNRSMRADLMEAMEQLGYSVNEVNIVISNNDISELSLEEAIKMVLQQIK